MTINKVTFAKKSILFSWILSYLMVLFLPILVCIFIYYQAERIIEEQVISSNNAMLKQVQQVIDGYLNDCNRIINELSASPVLNNLITTQNDDDPHYQFNIHQMKTQLNSYKLYNSMIEDIFIFLKNKNTVISSNTTSSLPIFYEINFNSSVLPYNNLEEILGEFHSKKGVPLYQTGYNENPRKVIAYMQSAPIIGVNRGASTIVILISPEKIKESIIGKNIVTQGFVMILDSKNNDLISQDFYTPSRVSGDIGFSEHVYTVSEILDNKNVVLSSIPSQIVDWKYVSAIHESVFWNKVRYIKRLTMVCTLLCILIGAIITYIFTKRNYNPLKELLDMISGTLKRVSITKKSDEYTYIQRAFKVIVDENSEMCKRLEKQVKIMQSNLISRLIKGRYIEGIDINESLSSFGITFVSDYFAVILINIENYPPITHDTGISEYNDHINLAHSTIKNTIETLANPETNSYVLDIDEMIVCLVNFKESDNLHQRYQLEKLTMDINDFLQRKTQFSSTISVSNIHQTIIGIPKAYDEAIDAMEYKMVLGTKTVIFYDDIRKNTNYKYYYPVEIEYKLINTIKSGNVLESNNIINELFDRNFSNHTMSIQMSKCLIFNLLSTILKASNELDENTQIQIFNGTDPLDFISDCNTIEEIRQKINTLIDYICSIINSNRQNNAGILVKKILEYIETNYNDKNLSVETICSHFGKSREYLFTLFKEETGEGILYHINRIRIEKSKVLLSHNNLKIKQIADQVGYWSVGSYLRVFKKIVGVTPGQFREL